MSSRLSRLITGITLRLMSGQVTVDDLGQLMAFKIAFSFNRAAFNAFLDERRRLAGATT